MGVTAAVIATTVLATTAGAVEANQQTQHAKGAAQATAQAETDQINNQAKMDQANLAQKGNASSATQAAAVAALRASMSASSGSGGSILTGPQGTGTVAPTETKSLLGA